MLGLWIALLILMVLVILYLLALRPNVGRKAQMWEFEKVLIAHRGLFDRENRPENSCAAFQAAVDAGYGIELDVQLTSDGKLVVFHDDSLQRMCGIKKKLIRCTWKELKEYRLGQSEERIPLFAEVLRIVDGRVPLIVEIKSGGDPQKTAAKLAEYMDDYEGIYCIESFHPLAVSWYRKNRPEVIRGQLSTDYRKNKFGGGSWSRFLLTNLLFNFYTRPDFIAYNYRYANQFSYRLCRALYHVENVAWTIQSEEARTRAEKDFQVIIFDSFIPS